MIRILVVDDGCLIQEGIKAILKDEPNLEIVGIASDGLEAIAKTDELQPDIVLLDIEMPIIDGITVTKYINKFLPAVKVIILSSHDEESYISRALEAGAASYLLKQSLVEDLKQAIYSLSRGYSYIEIKLLNQALNQIRANNIVNSHSKTAQNPKYRQQIQINAIDTTGDRFLSEHDRTYTTGIYKANLLPIFKASSAIEIKTAEDLCANLREISTAKPNQHQRINPKLLWTTIAIASFIISILIFK